MAHRPTLVACAARTVAATGAFALLCAGCGSEPVNCTEIGASSGVSFQFDKALEGHQGPFVVRTRVDGACDLRTLPTRRSGGYFMENAGLTTADPAVVSLTITAADEDVIFADEAQVALSKYQPNGSQCPPTVWQGRAVAGAGGDLQPTAIE